MDELLEEEEEEEDDEDEDLSFFVFLAFNFLSLDFCKDFNRSSSIGSLSNILFEESNELWDEPFSKGFWHDDSELFSETKEAKLGLISFFLQDVEDKRISSDDFIFL